MNINRNKILSFVLLICLGCASAFAAAPNAEQIMKKSASALLGGGGITASYTMKAGGHAEKGTLYVSGKKFSIISSSRSLWYDGKTLWNWNSGENEVTLSAPTAAEVATMNPYMLVSNYRAEYTARLVKGTVAGTYNVLLTPKNRNNYVKSATLCVRSDTYMPVRLDVTDRNGSKTSLIISGVKKKQKFQASQFKFPKAKYPGANVVDLR